MYDYKRAIKKSKTQDENVQHMSPREIDFIGEVNEKNTRHLIDFLCMCEAQDNEILDNNRKFKPSLQRALEPIKINITSNGGSVDLGLAIIDKLESIQAPIHTHVNGCAYSMGFILFLMGDVRTAGRFARFMNQGSSGYTWGYLPESKAILDNHEIQDALCDSIIINRCDYPMSRLAEAKTKCDFFGYTEALEYNIITHDLYALDNEQPLDSIIDDADEIVVREEITKVEHLEEEIPDTDDTETPDDYDEYVEQD